MKNLFLFSAILLLAATALAQTPVTLSGTVCDATARSGETPSAYIRLFTIDGQPVDSTQCDAHGCFTLRVPAGGYHLQVSLLGYYPTGRTLQLGADTRLDTIFLQPDYVHGVLGSAIFPIQVVTLEEMYDINRRHCVTTVNALYRTPRHAAMLHADIYHPFAPNRGLSMLAKAGYTFHFKPRLGGWGIHAGYEGGHYISAPGNPNPWVWNAYMVGFEYERFRHNGHLYHFRLLYRYTEHFELPFQFSFDWDIPRLFGVKGLSFSGVLDLWGDGYFFSDGWTSFKGVLGSMRFEPQVWYNLSRLWSSRGCGRYMGREGLGVFFKMPVNFNHPGGWHYGSGFYNNYGLNITYCLGLRWDF